MQDQTNDNRDTSIGPGCGNPTITATEKPELCRSDLHCDLVRANTDSAYLKSLDPEKAFTNLNDPEQWRLFLEHVRLNPEKYEGFAWADDASRAKW